MQITQKSKTDIAINCFRHGGGMESYTFDLVRGLRARGAEIAVYAAQADPAVPEYNQVEIHRISLRMRGAAETSRSSPATPATMPTYSSAAAHT